MRFAGPTYQDDSERSCRRKANEAETGWSQPAHKLQTRPPRQRSSLREFLCRIWYLCWNLTTLARYDDAMARAMPEVLRDFMASARDELSAFDRQSRKTTDP